MVLQEPAGTHQENAINLAQDNWLVLSWFQVDSGRSLGLLIPFSWETIDSWREKESILFVSQWDPCDQEERLPVGKEKVLVKEKKHLFISFHTARKRS